MSKNHRILKIQTDRGEVDPRMIVGVIVLIFIGPALLGVGVQIQSAFVALPGLNWFWATLIAGLLVLAFGLAALGNE